MREHFLLVAVIGFSLIVFFIGLIVVYIKLRYSKKEKQNTEVESRHSQELTAFKSDIGTSEREQHCEGKPEYFPRGTNLISTDIYFPKLQGRNFAKSTQDKKSKTVGGFKGINLREG